MQHMLRRIFNLKLRVKESKSSEKQAQTMSESRPRAQYDEHIRMKEEAFIEPGWHESNT
jgi:hypothetical protein